MSSELLIYWHSHGTFPSRIITHADGFRAVILEILVRYSPLLLSKNDTLNRLRRTTWAYIIDSVTAGIDDDLIPYHVWCEAADRAIVTSELPPECAMGHSSTHSPLFSAGWLSFPMTFYFGALLFRPMVGSSRKLVSIEAPAYRHVFCVMSLIFISLRMLPKMPLRYRIANA